MSSDGVHLVFFSSAEGCDVQVILPDHHRGLVREREREETHQAVTQAVVQLLEGICVGDRASLVEHIGMVG
jgi:hypothetical protein